MLNTVIYVISISFQLTGACILIWKYLPLKTRDEIKRNHPIEMNVNNEVELINVEINNPSDREVTMNLYLNRFAFILISLGYIIGALTYNESKAMVVLSIVLLSICLGCICYGVCDKLQQIYEKNEIEKREDRDSKTI